MIRHAALALLIAAPIAAQNIAVFPSDHTGTAPAKTLPGGTYTTGFPFSWGISHHQVVYESFDLNMANGSQIKKIGFPVNGTSVSPGYKVQMEVRMGHTNFDSKTITTTYANNYVGQPTTVFSKKIFTCPPLNGATSASEVWITFDTPFTYDSSKNLILEVLIYANSNSNQAWSYYLDGASFVSPVVSFGQGCATSGGKIPSLKSSATIIGSNWGCRLSNGSGSSAAVLNVGTPIAGGIDLSAFGAPGCNLFVSPLVSIPGTTSSNGSKSWNTSLPFDRSLIRAHIFSQAVMLDLFANNLGAVLSNGDDVGIGVRPLSTDIANQGNTTKTTGGRYSNYAPIIMFDHQ